MAELPSGTVTFLFSDIEGSTRHLQELGDDWEAALAAHNRILRESFEQAGGREVDRQGDSFFAVFPTAKAALAAAGAAQRALAAHAWPQSADVRVRMGLHTGEPSVGGEGYLGVDVVRAARICSAAHGGQVLVSETTRALVPGSDLEDVGLHQLKDMEQPERLFQLVLPDLPRESRAPRGLDRRDQPAPLPMRGRELELASRAAELAKRIGGLEELGPTIDRQVREALAARGIATPNRQAPGRGKGSMPPHLVFAAFVVLAFLVAAVLVVYLIIQAL